MDARPRLSGRNLGVNTVDSVQGTVGKEVGDRGLGAGNWGLRRGNWGQGTWDRELGAGNWGQQTGDRVQRRAEGVRYRSGSNIGWFRREAVGSPKKIEHPLGSEIFKPKVYSWEPSWYSGGVFKRKHFVAGAGNGARGWGGAAYPHAAKIKSLF